MFGGINEKDNMKYKYTMEVELVAEDIHKANDQLERLFTREWIQTENTNVLSWQIIAMQDENGKDV